MTFDVAEFKSRFPMPELMAKIGLGEFAKACVRSPFREDKRPSWGIFQKDGGWLFKDLATGDAGDEITLVARWKGLDPKADFPAVAEICQGIAGMRRATTTQNGSNSVIMPSRTAFDWQRRVDAFGSAGAKKLAGERGYSPEFIAWLRVQRLVGLCDGGLAFPVHDEAGSAIGCHHKNGDNWNVRPNKKQDGYSIPLNPLVIGDPSAAAQVFAFESQWDAFSVMDRLGWHAKALAETSVVITRGASNGKRLGLLSEKATAVYAFPQNDEAGKKWLADVAHAAQCKTLAVETPEPHKDANDWTRSGATLKDLFLAIEEAKLVQTEERLGEDEPPAAIEPGAFTIRKPDEFLAMEFDDSDIIVGERLVAKGQPTTILAAGGTGKSRILLQLAASVITGRPFLGFPTQGTELKWLVLQTENSNRRLQADFAKLKAWVGDDWPKVSAQMFIHTIETDRDGFVNLDNPENVVVIEKAIHELKPDVVCFDPLGDFAIGDPNKDQDMRATCQAIARLAKKGNPDRAIIVLHHSLTGKAGHAKATGFDRGSFGRNSKVLQAWTRAQINIAPGKPDSNDSLVISCGKNSNGPEFGTFAVKLNLATMIYEGDPHFDLAEWEAEMGAKKPAGSKVTVEMVADLCAGAMTKKVLARAIMDKTACCKQYAYRKIDEAEARKKIHYTKAMDTYVRK